MDKSNITLVSAFALTCVAGKGIAQNTQATQRPNILYIMCDDHAIQAISAYGSPISKLAPTPNIDRLARRGMIFNSAFCCQERFGDELQKVAHVKETTPCRETLALDHAII